MERELAEVNENPGGRALILEMLFRENVKEVQEGELEEKKKKRVLVKKRRKKTEEERRLSNEGESKEEGGGVENDVHPIVESKKASKWLWWGEEKVKKGSTSSVDQEEVVICVSRDGLETDIENIMGAAQHSQNANDPDEVMGTLVVEPSNCVEDEQEDAAAAETVSVASHVAIADDNKSKGDTLSPMSDDEETEAERENFNGKIEANETDYEVEKVAAFADEHSQLDDARSLDNGSVAGDDMEDPAHLAHEVDTPRAANFSKGEPMKLSQPAIQRLGTPELEGAGNITVQLAPRIRPQRSIGNSSLPQVLEPPFLESDSPDDISPMSPCGDNGEDAWTSSSNTPSYGLILPELSDFHHDNTNDDENEDTNDDENENANDDTENKLPDESPSQIFRKRESDDELDQIGVEPCMSHDTEVASNVDEVSKSSHNRGKIMADLSPAEIVPSYNLNSVKSHQTDGSSISYFSYEDVSLEDDEDSEMCAVCICPYEEGDIRVFSKHCSHVFHKECIFEWLIKGRNECPCCRKDMVTKSEIKGASASLLGTEILNKAMREATVEAPPLRRGPRLPRDMVAAARREAWRQWRASNQAHQSTSMTPQSPNAHWLWSARHQAATATSAATTHSVSTPISPTNTNTVNHNVDWLWTTRFDQVRTVRSTDAIDNNHSDGNVLASRSFDAISGTQTLSSNQQSLHHHATAGSLLAGRNLHPNWGSNNITSSRRASHTTSPIRLHPHWQQQQRTN